MVVVVVAVYRKNGMQQGMALAMASDNIFSPAQRCSQVVPVPTTGFEVGMPISCVLEPALSHGAWHMLADSFLSCLAVLVWCSGKQTPSHSLFPPMQKHGGCKSCFTEK